MGVYKAKQLALQAQGQAIDAVNVAQHGGVRSDEDKFNESLALAVANLSESFLEFLKDQP